MPTTARGIWTPSDTDAVDFTTHLATMAGTIDTAITNGLNTIGAGANAFKGTAAQRTAFLSTAVNGMLWQDTDSIKMIWRKDGAAWVPAVWRWSGTTSQMNAFTQAPNGFEWFNTTDNSDYVRLGGVWYKSRIESSASYVGANIAGPAIIVKTGVSGARPGAKALVQWSPISLAKTGAAGITVSSLKYTTDGTDPTGASPGMALQRSYVMASGSVTSAAGGVVPFTIPASGMLNVGLHIVGDTFYGPDEVFLTITVDN